MLQAIDNRADRQSLESSGMYTHVESHVSFVLPSQTMRPLVGLANALRTLLALQTDKYRPEAHYMRGPGPKCREKYAKTRPANRS